MLYKRLKELREELELNQEQVAKKINVSRSTYASWEIGRAEPSISMLIDISNFYNVSIDYLCGKTSIRRAIYKDSKLDKYINKCLAMYDEFFNKKDQIK